MSDYLALFRESGFNVCHKEALIDDEAQEIMENEFMVDGRFRGYGIDDLCVIQLRVAIKARGTVAET